MHSIGSFHKLRKFSLMSCLSLIIEFFIPQKIQHDTLYRQLGVERFLCQSVAGFPLYGVSFCL